MKTLGLVVSEKKIFYAFPIVSLCPPAPELMIPGARPFFTPGAWLAGFIKRTFIQCYIYNMKALGLVVSEKNFFYVFPIVSLWGLIIPRTGPFLTPGAWLAGFINRTKCYKLLHTEYESSGPCGFREEEFFYVFPVTPPGAGAPLAGFIQRTTIHCYTQNMKALGHVFPIVSLWELSVAMETRVLIRPGPKPNATFPPPQ